MAVSLQAPRWKLIGLYLAGLTLMGLAFMVQNYAASAFKGYPVIWEETAAWAFNDWAAWGLVAPIGYYAARRWPLASDTWRRHLPVHLGLLVVALTSHAFLVYGAELLENMFYYPEMSFLQGYRYYLIKKSIFDAMVYTGLVGLVHALSYYRLFREREVRASQLETRLARTQLQVLRAQLQPHFLFNTLNSIAALMHRDVDAADRMVTRLGDLLRLSLTHTERQEVPLRQELAFLDTYLDIQRTRFRDRLTATVDADPDTLDGLVPSLILQPLVENAIRHGIEPRASAGRVEVRARLEDVTLILEVQDDGPGIAPSAPREPNGCGIGLANTRARLEQLYGDEQRMTLSNGAGGLLVRLAIPYRVGQLPTPVHVHG